MRMFTKYTLALTLGALPVWSSVVESFQHALLPSASSVERPKKHPHHHHHMSLKDKEHVILKSFSNVSLSEWSYYYTHGLHLGGTNYSQVEWTRDKFTENGIPSHIVEYDVYLNYPLSHNLSLRYPDNSTFNASLEEDVLKKDETTGFDNRVPTFHGYSFTGNATAEYVYVGRGRLTDFQRLVDLGVPLAGKIALMKYGVSFRGLKVRNAQEFGMIGAIIYSDPGDDGKIRVEEGYAAYPKGPARNPSSVQRGSVQFLSKYPGDPTTPGYPSKPGVPREDKFAVTPKIPSLPISFKDAKPLLEALNGNGVSAKDVNITGWKGGLANVSYSTGPTPGAVLYMDNIMNDTITPIWNIIGTINGTIEDEVIVIGNHRDSWTLGGAGDPNSGSAILIELAKAFGILVKHGWKPMRTIVFASWDAEEYGLVGSTEWFEEFSTWAVPNMVAYLNVDIGVSGPNWKIGGVPELHDIIVEVMKKVPSPMHKHKSVYDDWAAKHGKIDVLGSGSDYTAFVHSGIASIDYGFSSSLHDPVYHYHSNYDSFHWMSTYGDPTFSHHVAAGQFLGLLALNLVEQPLLPLNAATYAKHLWEYYRILKKHVSMSDIDLDLGPLHHSLIGFSKVAKKLTRLSRHIKRRDAHWKRRAINNRLKSFERGFVSQGGLPGREFYKHLIYAPGVDTGYAAVTFPGITEALMAGDKDTAENFVDKTSKAVWHATAILALGRWKHHHGDHGNKHLSEIVFSEEEMRFEGYYEDHQGDEDGDDQDHEDDEDNQDNEDYEEDGETPEHHEHEL